MPLMYSPNQHQNGCEDHKHNQVLQAGAAALETPPPQQTLQAVMMQGKYLSMKYFVQLYICMAVLHILHMYICIYIYVCVLSIVGTGVLTCSIIVWNIVNKRKSKNKKSMGYQLRLVVLFINSLHNYANACLFLAHCLGETVATRSQAETCKRTFYITEKDTKLLKTHTP